MLETPTMTIEEAVRATIIVLQDRQMLAEWPTVTETNMIIQAVREMNEPMEIDTDARHWDL
jgi:hypothetical protein